MPRKIEIHEMTPEDKEVLKEIIEHCKKLDVLINSLSSKTQVNITSLEGDLKASFIYVGAYAEILQGLLDVDT